MNDFTVKMLEHHMSIQLGPGWFQELSEHQITAANMLFTAVGNDGVDCQLQRVIPILNKINIYPLPTRCQLVAALKFARGSDLAFLWFLYDRLYRTGSDVCTQKDYTLNERLILSCICHLDMLLTLRELERILPKVEKKIDKVKIEKRKDKIVKKCYKSPYDEPLPKPKYPTKEIIQKLQRKQPTFEIYKLYKDPYYIIENEVNRWFATSSLMPTEAQCVSQKILAEIADKVSVSQQSLTAKSFCQKHQEESSPFYKMMRKILFDEDEKSNMIHLNSFERGIIEGLKLELANAEKSYKESDEKNQSQMIVKTVLHQIIENAADLKFIHLCDKCQECLQSRDIFEQLIEETTTSSKTSLATTTSIIQYCQRTSPYGPLMFDYEKIFTTSFLQDEGAVRNSINKALELEKHLTEDNAITICLRDMWRLEMRLWNEKRQADIVDRQTQVRAEWEKVWGNKRKILKLLEDAIGVLRQNPKFVLAALPNSHKLPLLKEWILQKYGVKHTDEENKKKYKINKEQREFLLNTGTIPGLTIPTFKYFGIRKPRITIDEASRKAKEVRKI